MSAYQLRVTNSPTTPKRTRGSGRRLRYENPLHMLRHACGYKLANEGVDTRTIQGYLGHVRCN